MQASEDTSFALVLWSLEVTLNHRTDRTDRQKVDVGYGGSHPAASFPKAFQRWSSRAKKAKSAYSVYLSGRFQTRQHAQPATIGPAWPTIAVWSPA